MQNILAKTNRKYNYFRVSCLDTTLDNLIEFVFKNIKIEDLPQYLSVNVQVEGEKGEFFTIGERYPIDIKNPDSILKYNEFLLKKLDNLGEQYKSPTPKYFYLNYISIKENEYKNSLERLQNATKKLDISLEEETPLNLPLNIEYSTWGPVTTDEEGRDIIVINKNKTVRIQYNSPISNTIHIIANETVIESVNDRIISKNEFVRAFNNKEYYIRDSRPYFFFSRKFPFKHITQLKPVKNYSLDFLTLDIETYLDSENKMKVYCISFYDGIKAQSFYITDYESLESMLLALFKALFVKNYTDKIIYIHNSSMFDLIFLLKPLLNYPNIQLDPIIKDGKFINLNIKYGHKGIYQMDLRNSILLLPNSLAKLCAAFDVEKPKDIFPHKFVNKDNLDFIGPVPQFDYFNKVNIESYIEYKNRFIEEEWNLKSEAIKYCELNCINLYIVICNFGIFIYEMFYIKIDKCPTLPSLAIFNF